MKLAPARIEDVTALLALDRETVEAPHWQEADYLAAVRGTDEGPRRYVPVAWAEGQLLGFAVGRVVAGVGEIESVAVRVSARRQGVGRAVCGAVIEWAWTLGSDKVDLEVRAGSLGARALYAGLGFVEVGRRPGYYNCPVEDAVLMRLRRCPTVVAGL